MNRKEIKELAKTKIQGNKWNIIWPALLITVIESVLERILGVNTTINITSFESFQEISTTQTSTTANLISGVIGIVFGIIMVAYTKYILNFIRTGKFEAKDILNTLKEKWLNILIAEVLVGLIVFACSLLFVIPGIIMAMAYSMVTYIVVDTELSGVDSLKKSRSMMKGYKWDYFVFCFSFIGWLILTPFTFGLLLIWLYPYMTIARALYYEKLKEISK